jgi:hypothetical protein
MKHIKFSSDFCLEAFVEIYVRESIKLIKEKGELELGEFYRILNPKVAGMAGIDKARAGYLCRPFHWGFFSEAKIRRQIFKLEQEVGDEGKFGNYVKFAVDNPKENQDKVAEFILENNERYFRARIKKWNKNACSYPIPKQTIGKPRESTLEVF